MNFALSVFKLVLLYIYIYIYVYQSHTFNLSPPRCPNVATVLLYFITLKYTVEINYDETPPYVFFPHHFFT